MIANVKVCSIVYIYCKTSNSDFTYLYGTWIYERFIPLHSLWRKNITNIVDTVRIKYRKATAITFFFALWTIWRLFLIWLVTKKKKKRMKNIDDINNNWKLVACTKETLFSKIYTRKTEPNYYHVFRLYVSLSIDTLWF